MPGGKGNIKPSDGKQFSSEYQPSKEIWTEDVALMFCQDIVDWLNKDDENIFFDEFIFMIADPKKYHEKAKIYVDLPAYLGRKFSSCFDLLNTALKIQEIKLKKFGVFDKLNASVTKFCLINLHDWKDKTENENKNTNEFSEDTIKLLNNLNDKLK